MRFWIENNISWLCIHNGNGYGEGAERNKKDLIHIHYAPKCGWSNEEVAHPRQSLAVVRLLGVCLEPKLRLLGLIQEDGSIFKGASQAGFIDIEGL